MLIDAREVARQSNREYDLCIVGGGAAGITLARALAGSASSIAVLESGGFEFDATTQGLYNGETSGAGLNTSDYLATSRLRFFGGTTNHWGGWCLPLDPLDFASRPWIPDSGWPLTRADLEPYYQQAAGVVEIEPFSTALDTQRGVSEPSLLQDDLIVTRRLYTSPPTRFGAAYRRDLVESERIDLLLHANVVALDVNEAGTRVTRLRVATVGGPEFAVTARIVVLATGAVENARLLLASDAVHKTGLGNRNDLVGRFFMEHPECDVGYVYLTGGADALRTYRAHEGRMGLLCLSEEAQRKYELLNASFQLAPTSELSLPSEAGGVPLAIGGAIQAIDGLAQEHPTEGAYTLCYARAEPAPRRDSRVTLAQNTDALGMRRANLTWHLGSIESRTIQQGMEFIATRLAATQKGRMLLLYDERARRVSLGSAPWEGVHGGSHHMGTTRMSATPRDGVVDVNGKVHDVENLYVAGSSVFPTAGFANPTFTIIALTLRLAEHFRTSKAMG